MLSSHIHWDLDSTNYELVCHLVSTQYYDSLYGKTHVTSIVYILGVSPSLVSRWREAHSFWGI